MRFSRGDCTYSCHFQFLYNLLFAVKHSIEPETTTRLENMNLMLMGLFTFSLEGMDSNLLTTWIRDLLKEVIVFHLVMKISVFCEGRKFVTAFTRTHYWNLSGATRHSRSTSREETEKQLICFHHRRTSIQRDSLNL
jgi:hypothetical protein